MYRPEFLKALGALLLSIAVSLWPASDGAAHPVKPLPPASQGASGTVQEADFPARIAGMARAGTQRYDVSGLGYSVRYVSADKLSWADIYIYDKGLDFGSSA